VNHYDLIVLGSGSAARDAAAKAVQQCGASVAVVESTRWGGSCPNVACKPTKAYLVVAELFHDVNRLAEKLGIDVAPARIDLARVKARKDTLKKGDAKWMAGLREAGFDTYDGEAELLEPGSVRVGGDELRADRILIATGSRTAVPPIEGIDEIDWIDHVSALELTELPESLLVVGGGPVGLEFAQIFARFGSRVTIVQGADRISPRSDEEASTVLHRALEEDDGVEIVLSSTVTSVRPEGDGVLAAVGSREIRVAKLLLASGRAPNVEALHLDELGIEHDRAGILVDELMRTSGDGIWAAGDVTGRYQFTPIAQYQARIAVDDMFERDPAPADYSVLPTSIFTEPELAAVGLTEREARDQGIEHEVVVQGIEQVQRSSYKEQRRGLYKIVYETGTRRVLGLHVVAPNGGDIVHGLSLALRLGGTVDDLAAMHHVFPTFAEGVKAAAEQAMPQPVEMAAICN
jgi:pyruvate/2-oxoglutarate dehydrogenase complex dihydrolipoamide dehydrogenase (E3) component